MATLYEFYLGLEFYKMKEILHEQHAGLWYYLTKIWVVYLPGSISGWSVTFAMGVLDFSQPALLSSCLITEWIAHRNAIFDLAWLTENDLVSAYI